ncbi:hypothetical protein [Piscinibacter sp. HJYY11]|uniref:hypothetical protein n=1 Tax=Piscinibacter sp. HJYY11 TaxID=2801333 RepID=UPI00191E9F16|nr:hypothetical protein [Piscinibacter sp. HJYY11]MBL0727652.1 hypothetical protein [Piscinibacter sp. HJYY11]
MRIFQVSDRARQGLDHFVAQAARNSLVRHGEPCEVVPDDDTLVPKAPDVVMFTVTSYLFRVVLLIQFDRDPATRAYMAGLASTPVDEMNGERFFDTMNERGNLFCGAFNRDLVPFFPHIGMSTPCVLKRNSVEHITAVKPSYHRRFRCELAPGVAMYFTLALCADADFDFAFEPRAEEETDTAGELEMF